MYGILFPYRVQARGRCQYNLLHRFPIWSQTPSDEREPFAFKQLSEGLRTRIGFIRADLDGDAAFFTNHATVSIQCQLHMVYSHIKGFSKALNCCSNRSCTYSANHEITFVTIRIRDYFNDRGIQTFPGDIGLICVVVVGARLHREPIPLNQFTDIAIR